MRSLKGKNMVDLRKSNRARILEVLFRHGPISRAEISKITGLTPPTITALANELFHEGLLEEAGIQDDRTTVGRKRISLRLLPDSRLAIGVEIGVNNLLLGLVNLEGRIIKDRSVALDSAEPDVVIAGTLRAVNELTEGLLPGRIIGLGVGATGLVDSVAGNVRHSPNLNWRNVPLRSRLEQALSFPVVIDNNVRLMALGENMFFHNRGDVSRLALVHAGYGIGCGITINGQLYYGRSFGAGELGHTVLVPDGPVCSCGKKGCLEAVASGRAMTALHARKTGCALPIYREALRELLAAGDRGDGIALEILRDAGAYMGLALANLSSLLAPDLIVIHGGVFDSSVYTQRMLEQIRTYRLGDDDVVPVERSRKRDDLVILGAGALTIQSVLINDEVTREFTVPGHRG